MIWEHDYVILKKSKPTKELEPVVVRIVERELV